MLKTTPRHRRPSTRGAARAWIMRPPSSEPTGRLLSAEPTRPAQPAMSAGCTKAAAPVAAGPSTACATLPSSSEPWNNAVGTGSSCSCRNDQKKTLFIIHLSLRSCLQSCTGGILCRQASSPPPRKNTLQALQLHICKALI